MSPAAATLTTGGGGDVVVGAAVVALGSGRGSAEMSADPFPESVAQATNSRTHEATDAAALLRSVGESFGKRGMDEQ